jgi:UDP-N-acetylglucosamine--dolichyl-phosphate N-acetylglucosaminephosphotransferase
MEALVFATSAIISCVAVKALIGPLRRAGILGRDLHKPGHPLVPEMGGAGFVAGFAFALLLAIAMTRFSRFAPAADVPLLLAVLGTVSIAAAIGIADDVLSLRQSTKAVLPILAALPLVAMRVGTTEMAIPAWGVIDVGWIYPLVLLPIGVTVAANASNMLAGFNGLELGLGIVQMGSLAILAGLLGQSTALVILLAGLGALLGALRFNWFPAKVFVGDVGTLAIGTIVASAVIVGNFEVAGVLVYIPHAVDFALKARHRFPTTGWAGRLGEDGRLHPPRDRVASLPQLLLKMSGGIRERPLVLLLVGLEALFCLAAVLLYVLKPA